MLNVPSEMAINMFMEHMHGILLRKWAARDHDLGSGPVSKDSVNLAMLAPLKNIASLPFQAT